jgi:hypothetical protein
MDMMYVLSAIASYSSTSVTHLDGDIPRPAQRVGDYTKRTSQANLPKLNLNNTLYIYIYLYNRVLF